MNISKKLLKTCVCLGAISLTLALSAGNTRILHIKESISSKEDVIKLKDIVANTGVLTEQEKEYEITEAPKNGLSSSLTLVDLAYLFQKYDSLMDSNLRGPKMVSIKKVKSSEFLDKARAEILAHIKKTPPWQDWETDVVLTASDEQTISRIGAFDHLELKSYETKGLLGTVAFSVTFLDKDNKHIEKANINPVILKKAEAFVINTNKKIGEIVRKEDFKKVPVWLGAEKKDYILDESKCLGYELARNMNSGEMIKTGDILRPVCARKGDIIHIECISGPMTVRIPVTVMETGREGDFVKVKNTSSNKDLLVELTGEKEGVYKM